MSKENRFQYEYRSNASRLHKAVGDVLRNDSFFKNFPNYQEYPVNRINKNYYSGSHKFDWVIPKLFLVIECHGKQHYEVVDFGGGAESAIDSFQETKFRDKSKKDAALAAGWRYLVVPYTDEDKVNGQYLYKKYKEADIELSKTQLLVSVNHVENHTRLELANEEVKRYRKEQRRKYLESPAHKKELERAREYRREQYQRLKGIKHGSR